MLTREMHNLKCYLGHQFSSVSEAIARGATMVPLEPNEQPPLTSVKMNVWVHPKVKDMLEQRYRGRLIATLDSIFGCLADGNVMIITGADVEKLKKHGIANGTQMVAAINALDSTEREKQQLMARLEQFEQLLKVAGVV